MRGVGKSRRGGRGIRRCGRSRVRRSTRRSRTRLGLRRSAMTCRRARPVPVVAVMCAALVRRRRTLAVAWVRFRHEHNVRGRQATPLRRHAALGRVHGLGRAPVLHPRVLVHECGPWRMRDGRKGVGRGVQCIVGRPVPHSLLLEPVAEDGLRIVVVLGHCGDGVVVWEQMEGKDDRATQRPTVATAKQSAVDSRNRRGHGKDWYERREDCRGLRVDRRNGREDCPGRQVGGRDR